MLPSTEEIVARISSEPRQRTRQLARFWEVSEQAFAEFAATLFRLQREGLILRVPSEGWSLPDAGPYRVGTLRLHQRGHAYVRTVGGIPAGEEFFVSARCVGMAVTGDRVLIKITQRPGRRRGGDQGGNGQLREADVIEVIERSQKLIKGRYSKAARGGYVRVTDRRYLPEIYVRPEDRGGAHDGDTVLCRLVAPRDDSDELRGRVEVRVTDEGSYRSDLEMLCAELELPAAFPESALQEAAEAKSFRARGGLRERVDLRELCVFTIDPPAAQDFDDAVSLEKLSGGRLRLGVHIADVAFYVLPGSCLDVEAERRGTSIYLPGHVIPMLPERLSNQLCSLRPGEDRPAKTVRMTFSSAGELLETDIATSVIRSRRRFTYGEVLRILDADAAAPGTELPADHASYREVLVSMAALAERLQSRRVKRGALYLDIPKLSIDIDDAGSVTGLSKEERDVSHSLIEEFMLAANEAVAQFLHKKKLPLAARVHPPPNEEKFDDFRTFLKAVGVSFRGAATSLDLQRLIKQLRDDPLAPVIQLSLLRTMGHAEYTAERGLHFALATSDYCHFTSPIRRYPDLLVHQILDEHFDRTLSRRRRAAWSERLPDALARSSELERRAEDAEREMARLRLIRYLEPRLGEEMDGHVAFVAPFGFFVRIDENLIEGLVHVASLGGDYYEYDAEHLQLVGRRRKRRFSVGDRVRVQLSELNPDAREIGFRLVRKLRDRGR